jgi:hypothetical protein
MTSAGRNPEELWGNATRSMAAALLWLAFCSQAARRWTVVKTIRPSSLEFVYDEESASLHQREARVCPETDYPLNRDGALLVRDPGDGAVHRIDLDRLRSGFQAMEHAHPDLWRALMHRRYDEAMAEAFLRCCLHGR